MTTLERSFLNIDVDLRSPRPLDAMLDALGAQVLILAHHQEPDGSFASIELADTPPAPEAIAARLCDLFEALEGEARAAWCSCTSRSFNLGFATWVSAPGARAHCQETSLSPATLARIAALGAGLTISVYAR